nr:MULTISPECIES: UDP-N-acetylmuramate dehydrogenase [unclassified Psychrosphaera]
MSVIPVISVQSFHTFQLQANAKRISSIDSIEDCRRYIGRKNGKDFILLGEGSNCVFVEDYYGEIVIPKLFGKSIEEDNSNFFVDASASENWHEFVIWLLANKVYGLENLALIPGTVGASPIQNIGAYGIEVCQFISSVDYFDLTCGEIKTLDAQACNFGYRDSVFKGELKATAIITKVRFTIPKQWTAVATYGSLADIDNPTAEQIFTEVVKIRQSKLPDPELTGNAGSFFKNPIVDKQTADTLANKFPGMPLYKVNDGESKIAAGWLIDQAGLKGKTINDIAVHQNQALVLINTNNNGCGKDLVALVDEVCNTVFAKFGIELSTEVRCFGHEGELNLLAKKGEESELTAVKNAKGTR